MSPKASVGEVTGGAKGLGQCSSQNVRNADLCNVLMKHGISDPNSQMIVCTQGLPTRQTYTFGELGPYSCCIVCFTPDTFSCLSDVNGGIVNAKYCLTK